MKAPFPWHGGKSRVSHIVWERLGDPAVYCEPFAGSLAVLLGREARQWRDGRVETANDLDGFICNTWRAIAADPESVAHHADWPSNENDLHARNAHLASIRETFSRRVEGDPEWYDAKIAGWWLWGMAQWIGGGFAAQSGPWQQVETGDGSRQLLHLGDAGQGVRRKLLHLGDAGRGVSRSAAPPLVEWMRALAERLRRVRVASGDWSRVVTPSALALAVGGTRGIFLDPPYDQDGRDAGCYVHDAAGIAADVRAWCLTAPKDWRIVLCGYEGEHDDLVRHGWDVVAWKAQGGYGSQSDGRGRANASRERIWFSPACLRPAQRSLFG